MSEELLTALREAYEETKQIRDDRYKDYQHAQAAFLGVRNDYKRAWVYENRNTNANVRYDFPPE